MKRTLKKALSMIMVLSMVIAMLPAITLPASAEASGNWTDAGNYDATLAAAAAVNITITTPQQLAALAVAVNGGKNYSGFTVTLGANIDLSAHFWTPIGKSSTYCFAGSFNGSGYSITGMDISTTTLNYVGLFGYVSGTGSISGLNVSGTINSTYSSTTAFAAGGLVGYLASTSVSGCTSSVTMTVSAASSTVFTGGLVGDVEAPSAAVNITNCSASGSISTTGTHASAYDAVGGLTGYVVGSATYPVKITNCSSNVNLTDSSAYSSKMGGLSGTGTYLTSLNSYATGSVTNTSNCNNKNIGGFIGLLYTSSVLNNSYSTGNVTSTGTVTAANYSGGFVGYAQFGTVSNCYSKGTVTASGGATANFGGFVGNTAATLTNCYYPYDAYSGNTTVTGAYGAKTGTPTNLTGLTANQLTGTDDITNTYTTGTATYNGKKILTALNTAAGSITNAKAWTQASGVNSGYPSYVELWSNVGNYDAAVAGAAAANITISTPAQLAGLMVAVNSGKNYSGFTVTLGANIDLGAYGWMPIGTDATNYFAGSFNGAGYTISGMNINTVANQYVGLFGYVSSTTSTISNIKIAGTIDSSYTTTGYLYAGGLIGYNLNATVKICSSSVNVAPTSANGVYAGGLVGYYFTNAITSLVMSDCSASGAVNPTNTSSATSYAGGLIGYANGNSGSYKYTVQNSSFTGSITNTASSSYSGGVFGYCTYVTFLNCWTSGAVRNVAVGTTGNLTAGGFGGYEYTYSNTYNCYSTGNVTTTGTASTNSVAGFVGFLEGGGSPVNAMTNCYSTGTVDVSAATATTKNYGGFAGKLSYGEIKNCYYLYNAYNPGGTALASWAYGSGSATLTSLVGLTLDQLKGFANISTTYQSGSTTYNGKTILYALNNAAGSMTNAKSWLQTTGKNGDYPYYITNWTDAGNYDTTIANATAANRTITTAAQLAGLAVAVNSGKNYSGFTVTLGADIDLSAYNWVPIGKDTSYFFGGSFNGAGYKITGLNAYSLSQYGGLFGYVKGTGTFSNVNVAGTVYSGYSTAGLSYTGGLAGWMENTTLTDCTSSVNVTGNSAVGGLIGQYSSSAVASLIMSGCSSTGTVTAVAKYYAYLGGLVGNVAGAASYLVTIKNCLSTGSALCSEGSYLVYGGGLVGYQNGYVTIVNSGARGDVTVNTSSTGYIGGFVGCLGGTTAYIYNSYSTGSVKMTGTGNNHVGGFVGDASNEGTISNCYSAGAVTLENGGATWTGGFCGYLNNLTNTNCYYLYNAFSGNTKGYGTVSNDYAYFVGLTGAQLTNIGNITSGYG